MRKSGNLQKSKGKGLRPSRCTGNAEVKELDDKECLSETVRLTSMQDAVFGEVRDELRLVHHEEDDPSEGEGEACA